MTQVLIEGKTKQVIRLDDYRARIQSKDDITAGDGAKHDIMQGKAALSTKTTTNVFRLLRACGLPVAFIDQDSPTSFIAPCCRMLKWEVVGRRQARGSFLKRFPALEDGTRFDNVLIEFFLKTSGRRWNSYELPCDDPFAEIHYEDVFLHVPNQPFTQGGYFLHLDNDQVYEKPTDADLLPQMALLAKHAFLILEEMWKLLGYDLADFKVEFGLDSRGSLLIADVIDNDSWRLLKNGNYVDKQGYRDGDSVDAALRNYITVADESDSFASYQARLVTWSRQHLSRIA